MYVAIINLFPTAGSQYLECNPSKRTDDCNIDDVVILEKTIGHDEVAIIVDRMTAIGMTELAGDVGIVEWLLEDEKEIALFLLKHS